MFRRLFLYALPLFVAFSILVISIFRTASIKYDFSESGGLLENTDLGFQTTDIEYNLAFPGRVLPGNFLWPLKATRDKIWLMTTTNKSRKAELLLLFADKRLASGKFLFETGDIGLGFATLDKAEKYLEEAGRIEKEARLQGINTHDFLRALAFSSLKHYEIIEALVMLAPEEVRPKMIELHSYSIDVYRHTKDELLRSGYTVPNNPFNWN